MVYARRLIGTKPALARAVLNVAQVIADELSTSPLCYAGDPPEYIALSEPYINAHLIELERMWQAGIPAYCGFANQPNLAQADAHFVLQNSEITPIGVVEAISCGFEYCLTLEKIIELLGRICLGFGAFQGYYYAYFSLVRDDVNGDTYYIYQDDGTDHQVNWGNKKPPQLLYDYEFNFRYVPDQIYWINYWDSTIINNLGKELILQQPWARIVEQPQGGLILVPTEEPPNGQNSKQIDHLREILENLCLEKLQHKYRIYKK